MYTKLQIDSWKSAVISACFQAFLSVLLCVAYSYIIFLLTGGRWFINKDISHEVINGIRFDVVLAVCGVLESLIPIILLSYNKVKFLILYIPVSIVFYLALMFFCIDSSFDVLNYAILPVPIGSLAGTIAAVIITTYRNLKNDN